MNRIEDLRTQVAKERASWTGRRWRCSAMLKKQIREAARQIIGQGWSIARLAAELGLDAETLRRWLKAGSVVQTSGFRRVEVDGPALVAGLTVLTRSGHRVEGLRIDEVVTLLARLG